MPWWYMGQFVVDDTLPTDTSGILPKTDIHLAVPARDEGGAWTRQARFPLRSHHGSPAGKHRQIRVRQQANYRAPSKNPLSPRATLRPRCND